MAGQMPKSIGPSPVSGVSEAALTTIDQAAALCEEVTPRGS
jgi:hypothetical protein